MFKLGKICSVWLMFMLQELAKLLLCHTDLRVDTENCGCTVKSLCLQPKYALAKAVNNQELWGLHFSEILLNTSLGHIYENIIF